MSLDDSASSDRRALKETLGINGLLMVTANLLALFCYSEVKNILISCPIFLALKDCNERQRLTLCF